jgi:hypothetical protein
MRHSTGVGRLIAIQSRASLSQKSRLFNAEQEKNALGLKIIIWLNH